MSLTPHDELHLTRALDLARNAAAFASPNPTVGCVLTHNNTLLGEGAHYYDARDHAEIAALKQANYDVRNATAYVTLEPCSHHGRTGPCSDALIAAGIARCVVATVDPNPLVSGQGLAKLRAAHIEVTLLDPTHPLAQQARRLNDAFAFSIQHHRPFVTLKAALSVDGKLAPPPSTRTTTAPHWVTGTAARADAQHLRHASDALLTGIGTVLADNPSLTDRTHLPRRRPLLRVLLDTNLRTPLDSHLLSPFHSVISTGAQRNPVISTDAQRNPVISTDAQRNPVISTDAQRNPVISTGAQRSGETPVFPAAHPGSTSPSVLILCSENPADAPTARESALRARNAEVLRLPTTNSHLDLQAALAALAQRSILSVLIEAGPSLNGSLLRDHLVDKLVLYYAESELGLNAVPFATGFDSPYALQQRLTQTTRATFPSDLLPNAEDVRITGYLHDPWP